MTIYIFGILFVALLALIWATFRFRSGEARYQRAVQQLTELYYERGKLVGGALAPRMLEPPTLEEGYAFSGWVELLPGGRVRVSGETFDPTTQAFEVVARDESRIRRATVASDGHGRLFITSHGLRFCAKWENGSWSVVRLGDQNALPSQT